LTVEALKSPSASYSSCVSLLMILCLKNSSKLMADQTPFVQTKYEEMMVDWSTKANSKVQVGVFDDLLTRYEQFGASILLTGVCKAMSAGKNDYCKAESFRIGSKIVASAMPNPKNSAAVVVTIATPQVSLVCEACNTALIHGGGAALKTKRVKDVLLCVEKLIAYGKKTEAGKGFWKILSSSLNNGLEEMKTKHQSDNVQKLCAKYLGEITEAQIAAKEDVVVASKSTPSRKGSVDKQTKAKSTPKSGKKSKK
jgi:hypothetical protein